MSNQFNNPDLSITEIQEKLKKCKSAWSLESDIEIREKYKNKIIILKDELQNRGVLIQPEPSESDILKAVEKANFFFIHKEINYQKKEGLSTSLAIKQIESIIIDTLTIDNPLKCETEYDVLTLIESSNEFISWKQEARDCLENLLWGEEGAASLYFYTPVTDFSKLGIRQILPEDYNETEWELFECIEHFHGKFNPFN